LAHQLPHLGKVVAQGSQIYFNSATYHKNSDCEFRNEGIQELWWLLQSDFLNPPTPQSLNYRLRAPKASPFPCYIQVQRVEGSIEHGAERARRNWGPACGTERSGASAKK
jgi:hypothetical protein